MRILIVRHGDPDYAIDGLTEKGKREVQILADRLTAEKIDKVYCSPLGRARLTAKPTLDRLGISAEYCDWLREFDYVKVIHPGTAAPSCPWDVKPSVLATMPEIFSPTDWHNASMLADSHIRDEYERVCAAFDAMLECHGYKRDGYSYRAVGPNHDTVVLFCHFGVEAVLLSHIMNCSPYSLWQNMVALTTSVTTLYTEEREEGIASFRCCGFGDLSHLAAVGEEPSFAARFCECFTDDTRH